MAWNKDVPSAEITDGITDKTVSFAREFGEYLSRDDKDSDERRTVAGKLTTNQLRKFFGEVKRQQLLGYDPSSFVMLKPKLAYAVGRADKTNKIKDFYKVIVTAMGHVRDERTFKNFVQVFEAIVAYHKAYEAGANI